MITEITLYLRNVPGELHKVLNVLNDVNIYAFNIESSGEYTLTTVRIVCEKVEYAIEELGKHAYSFTSNEVFAIGSSHEPGQLKKLAKLFKTEGINIESGYLTLVGDNRAINLLSVKKEHWEKVKKVLQENGIKDYTSIPEIH